MVDKNESKSLPKWVVQLLAWGTGVGGLVADYGFGLFGGTKGQIPFVYYALCVGIGFGINPGFIVKVFLDGYAAARKTSQTEDPEK